MIRKIVRVAAQSVTALVAASLVLLLWHGVASAAVSRHFYIPSGAGHGAASGDVSINGTQVCVRDYFEGVGADGYVSARAFNSAGQQILNVVDSTPGSGFVCANASGIAKVTGGMFLYNGHYAYADFMSNNFAGYLHQG